MTKRFMPRDCKSCGGKGTVGINNVCSACKGRFPVYKPQFSQSFSTPISPESEPEGSWDNGIKILEQ